MSTSKNKVEQKAINKIESLIDDIEYFLHKFKDMDKNISWDGTIEMYNGNPDIKQNYDYTIDVQAKGRTTHNKKFNSKYRFPLDRADLENYLKKDGTILIACLFNTVGSDYKLYYANLLPYNIRALLKQYTSDKIKIDMKEIKNSNQFEAICRNFKLDREVQKGIKANIFDGDNLSSKDGKVAQFYEWNKNSKNFNPQTLVGSWKYIYTLDENGYAIGVNYGMLFNLVESLNVTIYDKSKEIAFSDVKLETTVEGKKILFAKAFTMDFIKNKFNIKICGTIYDRIKQLQFIDKIFLDKGFLVNDIDFNINIARTEQSKFKKLLEKYNILLEFLKKHKISKEINFDNWDDKDFNNLEYWINAIDNQKPITLNSEISLLGSINIKEIRLSIFATIRDDGKFDVSSIWNNNIAKKYYFRYGDTEDSIETNNFYLVLNSQAYQSDDINFDEMKNYINNMVLSDDEYNLMNFQLLEVLKAYDITQNKNLLDYAKYLANILLENDPDSPVYYINYVQILKRENKVLDENYEKLLEIKDKYSSIEIKICCNLLLENNCEANILTQRFDPETLEEFKKYPIAIYL